MKAEKAVIPYNVNHSKKQSQLTHSNLSFFSTNRLNKVWNFSGQTKSILLAIRSSLQNEDREYGWVIQIS